MTRTSVVAFLLGILVSAAIYEATGVRFIGGRTSQVSASTRRAQVTPSSPATGLAEPTVRAAPPPQADKASEIARLRAEAAELRGRAAFAEGQLTSLEGREVPWPKDVATEYKQASVENQLKEFVVDRGLAKIKSVDCSEYPCVEVLQLPDTGPQAMQKLHTALNEMIKRYYKGSVALSISGTQNGDGADAVSLAGVSVMPDDEDLKSRTRYRTDTGLQEHAP